MSTNRANGPPPPGSPATPAELTERLRELRRWAGQPSLRRLRQLGGAQRTTDGGEIDALPESTTSYVLRGDRPASAQFVRTFVAACLRARQLDPDVTAEHVERWHESWLHAAGNHPAAPAANPSPPGPVPPRQLPAGVGGFTGRATELATLHALTPTRAPAPPAVAVITGTAGVGKTALAIHAAHHLAEHYPDGHLFIDLHGFSAEVTPVEPAGALDRLLRALGVPGERIPVKLEDRAAMWRTVLAGRRMLVVLDNAAAEQQVAPLLPGASGCLVLVTSRRRLTGLDTIHPVPLDVLPATDALVLFDHVAGSEPRTLPRELAAEAVELCGRLPLAIRIAAARLRSHPTWRITDLLARLRDQDHRLAELADDSGGRSVAAALEVSHQQLPADLRHLYQLLGLHPGHHLDPYATAALADTNPQHARRLLNRLLDAHLLQEPTPDRYAFHDLIRTHAAHLATTEPGPRLRRTRRTRRAALTRLLDYYRHAASMAMDVAYPYERVRRPQVPHARTPIPDLPDPAAAIDWLDTELPNLLAVAHHAAGNGRPEHTCQLSAILRRHLRTRGHHRVAESLHHQALTSGHPAGVVSARLGLGWVHTVQGRYDRALDVLGRAWDVARGADDHTGASEAAIGLGRVHWQQGRYEQAVSAFGRGLDLARVAGDRTGESESFLGLGQTHLLQGRYRQAADVERQAWRISRTNGNRTGELNAVIALGRLHWLCGQHELALDSFTTALAVARGIGNRNGELNALQGLGHVHLTQGRYEPALDSLEQAREIARSIGHDEQGMLVALGDLHRLQGRYEPAEATFQQVLDAACTAGDRNREFEGRHGLGRLQHATGHQELAIAHHQEALKLADELGQPADQARARDGLARAHLALGHRDQARAHWQRALDILVELGTDHTGDVEANAPAIRAYLAELDPDSTAVSGG